MLLMPNARPQTNDGNTELTGSTRGVSDRDGMSRRTALGLAGLGAVLATAPSVAFAQDSSATEEETKSLDQMYEEAVSAGSNLVVYAGGDHAAQLDATKQSFLARFPKMKPVFVVDYSKFHDVRVDNQFATNSLVPDVIQFQTLQNFPRWKREGRLLNYKPAGFSQVHEYFKDPDGAWHTLEIYAFSFLYQAGLEGAPQTPLDLVDPKWKGNIHSSYPHDDDAVLYLFKLYVDAYGWDWLAKFAAQDVAFARGSHTPEVAVYGRFKAIGAGASGTLLAPANDAARWVVPDGHPFMAWGQRVAVLKDAKNLAAAKLYLNWLISPEVQQAAWSGWSMRKDVQVGGLKPIWEYSNSHVNEFPAFMEDRALVERWKQTMALYFGEVKGDPSPGWLGLHPGR
jgi:ABC-type Fe3+ transport system substrate-binding protein